MMESKLASVAKLICISTIGVHCALEVLRVIHEQSIPVFAPLAIVNWTNEEGARFLPSMLGSGVWCGQYSVEFAHDREDQNGKRLAAELQRIGYLKHDAMECSHETNPLLAHLEVHIEQGPVLDTCEESVAAVSGIQGIRWYDVRFNGRETHAGTTPMSRRKDALLAAATVIVEVNKLAKSQDVCPGSLTTVGVIRSSPQAINTISGQVQINLDIRSPQNHDLDLLDQKCQQAIFTAAEETGVEIEIRQIFNTPPVVFDNIASTCVREAARAHGYEKILVSGAGHDRYVNLPAAFTKV